MLLNKGIEQPGSVRIRNHWKKKQIKKTKLKVVLV